MIASLSAQQISILIIMVLAFVLLITERIGNDVVGVLILLSLFGAGILNLEEAFSGFASEPAIVVMAMLVLSGALYQTGLSDLIGARIARLAGSGEARILAVIMPSVALLSAFTHHVTTTALMLPVTLSLSRTRGIAASRLLMPLSMAASLGTTITIIGAPAFIVASGVLQQAGRPGLSIFSIAPLGLSLTLVGTLYVLTAGRLLLPVHHAGEDAGLPSQLAEHFTELTVLPGSPLQARTVAEVETLHHQKLEVVGWVRDEQRLPRPYGDRQLRAGDVILVRTTPDELLHMPDEMGVKVHRLAEYGEQTDAGNGPGDLLLQVMVAPDSDLIGRILAPADFRRRYGVSVLGLWRGSSWVRGKMERRPLRAGDVLVLEGRADALNRIVNDPAFLVTGPVHHEASLHARASLAGAIMLGTILVASLSGLPLAIVTAGGAVLMVLSGCLTRRQAYRAMDPRIYVFIAGVMPLALAMQRSGVTALLVGWLRQVVGGWPETVILLLLFAAAALLTQFMSDAATTAVLAPVAVALAQALGHTPEPFVVTVAMAAVASFLTPIGHHGNLLVYGPGHYRFADFVRVGAPLTLLIALVVTLISPVLW